MSYSHPGAGFRYRHVLVFLGVVVLAVEIATVRTMGNKAAQLAPAPTSVPPAPAPVPDPAPAPAPVPEATVEVLVATRDLPIGTVFTADGGLWTTKKIPIDALPSGTVANTADLIGKCLSRPLRANETIGSKDLTQGLILPEGYEVVILAVGERNTPGFIVPGSRVDLMASLRIDDRLRAFDLLVNVLVVSVDYDITNDKNGVYPDATRIGFALTKQQATVLELARARGCNLMPKMRNPQRTAEDDAKYNIYEVIKFLENKPHPLPLAVEPDAPRAEVAPPPRPANGDH